VHSRWVLQGISGCASPDLFLVGRLGRSVITWTVYAEIVEGYCTICDRHHPMHHPRKHGIRRTAHFLHDNSHVRQVTSREYCHLARIEHHAYWFSNLKSRYLRYVEFIAGMPLLKTASSTTLLARYEHMWAYGLASA
jgi:hypothetical protein